MVMNKKPIILFCDDKLKWTEQFYGRHHEEFDIRTTNDALAFKRGLCAMQEQGEVPDIILIDLYHPNGDPKSDEQIKLEVEGQKAISQLEKDIKKAKNIILKTWSPYGYVLLEQARALCPVTPVAIYTEQGLTLADNEELELVSRSGGEWFLKGKTVFYENLRLEKMLPHQRTTTKKPLIFYCDDKKKWTELFIERHHTRYNIKTTNNAMDFRGDLETMLNHGEVPDIILIDLYHPNCDPESDEQKRLEVTGQKAINQLDKDINKAKDTILMAWNPCGYDMLVLAREQCPNTPISIYTEQGLALANNDELDLVSRNNGEWFLKGKSAIYESTKLKRMLINSTYNTKRPPKAGSRGPISVVIASPSDTQLERTLLLNNLEHRFRTDNYEKLCGHRIIVSGWEDLASQNGEPQRVINRRLIENADFVVAVFKNKLGTPTVNRQTGEQIAESGTVEELLQALDTSNPKHPIGMAYFCSEVPMISLDARDRDNIQKEWDRLNKFKETLSTKMLYKPYKDPADLLNIVLNDLVRNIYDHIIPIKPH